NPFEGARTRDFPNPPRTRSYVETLFTKAATDLGYHPFPVPAAQMSRPYTNPDGITMGACLYCGYCMNYPCEVAAKATPQTAVLPAAFKTGNYELRSHAAVQRINVSGNRATSVTYVDAHGREVEQPADLQGDNFDHAGLGFVGGAIIQILAMGWGPLTFQPTPPGTPTWGSAWKKSVAYYYNRSAQIVGLHDHLSYRGNYLSLDPTYRD